MFYLDDNLTCTEVFRLNEVHVRGRPGTGGAGMAGTQPEGQPGAVPGAARERDRRADARRNIASILDAAQDCLSRDPTASIADIAQAAGVGRVTLYGHFGTRA